MIYEISFHKKFAKFVGVILYKSKYDRNQKNICIFTKFPSIVGVHYFPQTKLILTAIYVHCTVLPNLQFCCQFSRKFCLIHFCTKNILE